MVSTLEGASQQQWQIPRVTDLVQRIAEENKVYIYNVGPQMWVRYQGGMGTYVIRACSPGQRFSEPCVIKGIVGETNPVDAGVMTLREYDGIAVANDIIGKGAFREKSDDLTRFGVFMSRSYPPLEEELESAEALLSDHDAMLIAEGNRLYEVNGGVDSKTGMSNIQKHHIDAAKRQGQNPPWTRKAVKLAECPNCSESIKPGAAKCVHCGAVLDEEKARKYFPQDFAPRDEKRGPGRPPKEVV